MAPHLLAYEARLFRERRGGGNGGSGNGDDDGGGGIAYRASMTRFDYDVLSLSSVTGRTAADCRRALVAAGNDVNTAVSMLY